jgi:hypothetical protein
MRRVGREEGKRIASLVLVVVVATFSLPFAASAVGRTADGDHTSYAHIRRLQVEARPVAARRPLTERAASLPTVALVVAALVVVGLLVLADAARPAPTPGLLPVQRGPPSSR